MNEIVGKGVKILKEADYWGDCDCAELSGGGGIKDSKKCKFKFRLN